MTLSETSFAGKERLGVTASHPDGIARIRVYVDGSCCADVTGSGSGSSATIAVSLQGLAIGTHDVLAVAYAANALVERPSWPAPLQHPQPDVQGWACGTLEHGASLKLHVFGPAGLRR